MIFYVQTISEDVMITRHTKMKLYTVESELTHIRTVYNICEYDAVDEGDCKHNHKLTLKTVRPCLECIIIIIIIISKVGKTKCQALATIWRCLTGYTISQCK